MRRGNREEGEKEDKVERVEGVMSYEL